MTSSFTNLLSCFDAILFLCSNFLARTFCGLCFEFFTLVFYSGGWHIPIYYHSINTITRNKLITLLNIVCHCYTFPFVMLVFPSFVTATFLVLLVYLRMTLAISLDLGSVGVLWL